MKIKDYIDCYREQIRESEVKLDELPEDSPEELRTEIKKRIECFIDWIYYIEDYEDK